MRLAKFAKGQGDRKRYTIDYSQWLDEGEVLTEAVATTNVFAAPEDVYVDGLLINPMGEDTVIMFVSGGTPGHSHEVEIDITTSGEQRRLDTITFVVSR